MDFRHSEERRMLADTLGRYLGDTYGIDTRHAIDASDAGWSAEHWRALADLGVTGALVGEAAGGFGGEGFDIAAVFEQLGRALVVEPFLPTLMGARVLERTGAAPDLLAAVVDGTQQVRPAFGEPGGRDDPAWVTARADRSGDGWNVTGIKGVVPQVESADALIVTARPDGGEGGIALFRIARDAPGVSVRGCRMIDGGRGGEVVLDAAPAELIAENGLPIVEDAIAAGIVALAWEAVGMLDVLRESTLEYLRTRRQFGVPIGRFQALQHRMATVALEIEQARSSAINAAAALGGDPHARDRAAAAAKYTIGHVGRLAAEEAIQMHGGIGMTWELPLSHYAKRLVMIDHQLGDGDHHLMRFAALGRAA